MPSPESPSSDHPGTPPPYVAASTELPELGPLPLALGALLGILFGASSMYLVLKVGVTVSASIPVAVLSITLFRVFSRIVGSRRATILENNIVQTTGSAGESIAFGVGVTMPALLILGYDLEPGRVILVSVLGGLLGILMMIPLRRALIATPSSTLVYPEGTACAEVLISGEEGGTTAKTVFAGLGVGALFALTYKAFGLLKDIPEKLFGRWYDGGSVALEIGPELLGVGYIIGTRIALVMGAGGVLSALVLTPAIKLFGSAATAPIYPAAQLIRDMSPTDIWHQYILYIGAGAVAAGGIVSLVRALPTLIGGATRGLASLGHGAVPTARLARTDRDLPRAFVWLGAAALVLACTLAPWLRLNLLGAVLVVMFGFLFVTVSSRLTGEIGSSSNPISGMTLATLLLTSLIFLALGWVSTPYKVTALSVAAVVCIAASNGGTTSQDLKTGFLVGATPSRQQIAILVGTLSSALVIGFVLLKMNDAATIYARRDFPFFRADMAQLAETTSLRGPDAARDPARYHVLRLSAPRGEVPAGKYLVGDDGRIRYLEDPGINGALNTRDGGEHVAKFSAPKAMLMSLIIDGIMSQKLPWGLVLIGVFIALVLELCGLSSLAFAVGVYLPLSTSTPIMVGGLVRWLVERSKRATDGRSDESGPGVLFSSGLIAGASVTGMAVALMQLSSPTRAAIARVDLSARWPALSSSDALALFAFLALAGSLYLVATGELLRPPHQRR